MYFNLSKKEAEEIMKTEGEVRGTVFKTDEKFILHKGGENKLKEVEKELENWGFPLKYTEAKNMHFYPIGMRVLSLLAIAKSFNFNENQVKDEIGLNAPKMSFIVKIFAQYFFSVEKTFNQVSKIWSRHYSIGDLIPVKLDEKEKEIILELQNFKVHPILCNYLLGYFTKISEIVVKSPVQIEEIECEFRGGFTHKFLIKW